jgi:LysR family hydrogen peroxide-inducible transcriptional activator
MVELAKLSRDPLSGKLRVALIPTLGPYLLPSIAPKLRRALPKLQLLLYEYQTEVLLKRLRDGEIDLGLLALGHETAEFEQRALFDEPFTVALPAAHPLAKKAALKVEELSGETLLLLEDGHCLRDQALEVCGRIDAREAPDFRATSLETLRQMVAAGLGITLLPELATEGPFAHGRNVAVRPFAKPVPRRTIGAVWRRSSTRLPAIAAVCDVIAESVQTS